MSLLKAFNGILAHVEQMHALPGLLVNFAENEKSAQLNVLFTGDRLRAMLKEKEQYAVDIFFFNFGFVY